MSSKLKTSVLVDDSLIFDGNTIDAINHTNPLEDAQDQLREGQVSVSSADTHIKHLEDAITGASGKVSVTKQDSGADESLEVDLDATGITSGYVPTANGADGWAWAASGGGGASPVDVNGTAAEALAERDYVYLDESSGTWYKVDVDDVPIRCGRVRGVVNEAGGISSSATGSIRLIGEVSGYSGLTAWEPVYADRADGQMTQTRPSPVSGEGQVAIIQIGIAISTTNIVVLPQQPAQYMKRASLADDGTLTITHHTDEMAHLRRAFAYIGSSEAGATLTSYADTNQDDDLNLKQRTVATYGSDITGTGTPSTSGAHASYPVANAFDDDTGTQTGQIPKSLPWWIEVDYGASKTIRRYTVRGHNSLTNVNPADWTFEYYNGSSWVAVDTQSGLTWSAGETKTFDIDTAVAAERWRINITANGGGSDIWITEIEMMEVATYTNGYERLHQSFQLSSGSDVKTLRLYLKTPGSPSGNLTAKIQTDNTGEPSGTTITNGTSDTVAASGLTSSYAWIEFTFSTAPTLSGSTTYHIVLETTDSYDEFDYVQWGIDSSSPSYADGEAGAYDGSSWSTVSADAIFEVKAPGTTFVEPAVLGRWSGGTRDVAIRYDDGSGSDGNTKTTCKNVVGAEADVTLVVEIP